MSSSDFGQGNEPEPTREQIAQLIEGLTSENLDVFAMAAEELSEMGAAAASAVPPLVELLQDENCSVPDRAAVTLGMLGTIAAPAVPALIELLKDPTEIICSSAAFALGRIGSASVIAVPALLKRLNYADREVGSLATVALSEIATSIENEVPSMDDAKLLPMLTLWQDTQTRLDTAERRDTFYIKNFEEAQAAVRRLVEALQQEKQARSCD